jgi:hypothetical protein
MGYTVFSVQLIARWGRGVVMAKDMSNTYADMLTKELVSLRAKHISSHITCLFVKKRGWKTEDARLRDLIRQINHELATRISDFGLKV